MSWYCMLCSDPLHVQAVSYGCILTIRALTYCLRGGCCLKLFGKSSLAYRIKALQAHLVAALVFLPRLKTIRQQKLVRASPSKL